MFSKSSTRTQQSDATNYGKPALGSYCITPDGEVRRRRALPGLGVMAWTMLIGAWLTLDLATGQTYAFLIFPLGLLFGALIIGGVLDGGRPEDKNTFFSSSYRTN